MNSQVGIKLNCKSFCYFQVGDIITRDPGIMKVDSCWCHKEVRLTGFANNQLWAVDENEKTGWTDKLDGLLLLARPGWKYRVGDKVCFRRDENIGGIGNIVMLDPKNPESRYLVDFKEDPLLKTVAGVVLGKDLWVPVFRRDKAFKNCLFLTEEEIIGRWII